MRNAAAHLARTDNTDILDHTVSILSRLHSTRHDPFGWR